MQARSPWRTSGARRRAILAATLECMVERGYAGTTVADIQQRCGASVGSIYHHFGGKEQLAVAVYLDALRDYQEGMLERVHRAGGARALLDAIVGYHLQWTAEHPRHARYLNEMRRLEPLSGADSEIRALNRSFVGEVGRHVAPYVQSGELMRYPAELYLPLIIGPAQELIRLWLRDPARYDLHAATPVLCEAAWKALHAGS